MAEHSVHLRFSPTACLEVGTAHPHRRVVDEQRRLLACPCWLECAGWAAARKVVEKDVRAVAGQSDSAPLRPASRGEMRVTRNLTLQLDLPT